MKSTVQQGGVELQSDIILYDWLSFTVKTDDVLYIQELLGLEGVPWTQTKGAKGYRDRLYFNAISIHFNGREDMGVWCEMSGQGCRAFESLSILQGDKWQTLFGELLEVNAHITRLDVAGDDHTGTLDIDQIISDTQSGNWVSKSRYWEFTVSAKGKSVVFGSPKSDTRIRIYDKAAERNCPAGEHWIRVEMQLRDDRAGSFLEKANEGPFGEVYAGVLNNYLRFVEPQEGDTNRWRWPMKDYWDTFTGGAAAIRLYEAPGLPYNLDRLEHYVLKQSLNATKAYIKIKGIDNYIWATKASSIAPNPKYSQLVELHGKYASFFDDYIDEFGFM